MDNEARQALYEQEKIKETLATAGAQILLQKLRVVARETYHKEAKADPFTQPGEIIKARQLRYVINRLIPQLLEGMVNYDPEAKDKQVAPKDRWTVFGWIKQLFKAKAGKD
jgi:hypothetical protein